MARRDQQREAPLSAPAAKMRERTRRSLQQQLDGAQTELQEMTEEELRRAEHRDLSMPDTAADLRTVTDQRRAHEPMHIAVDRRGPAM